MNDLPPPSTGSRIAHAIANAAIGKLWLKLLIITGLAIGTAVPLAYRAAYPDELIIEFTMGKPTAFSIEPGPHFIWPVFQRWERYDASLQYLSISEREAQNKNDVPGIGAITADNHPVGVVVEIHYKIDKAKGRELTAAFGYQESDKTIQKIRERVTSEAKLAVRTLCPFYTMEQLLKHRPVIINNTRYLLGISDTFERVDGASVAAVDVPRNQTSLNTLGLIVDHFSMAFEPDDNYRLNRDEIRAEEGQKDVSLAAEKRLAQELKEQEIQTKLDEEKARSQAASRRALIDAESSASFHSLFLEKWDGRLPSILVVGDGGPFTQGFDQIFRDSVELRPDKGQESANKIGAANGSQPIRSETNRTSSAAGSRR